MTRFTKTRIQVRRLVEVMPVKGVSASRTGISSPLCSEPTAAMKMFASASASDLASVVVAPLANARWYAPTRTPAGLGREPVGGEVGVRPALGGLDGAVRAAPAARLDEGEPDPGRRDARPVDRALKARDVDSHRLGSRLGRSGTGDEAEREQRGDRQSP